MSHEDPQPLIDNDGHTPSGLDVVLDYLQTVCPGQEDTVSGSYKPDAEGIQRFAEILPGGQPMLTFGTAVFLETYRIAVSVIAPTLEEAQDELFRLRYLLASAGGKYASRGLDLMAAIPTGSIEHVGPDGKGRQMVEAEFNVMTGPSYV